MTRILKALSILKVRQVLTLRDGKYSVPEETEVTR